MGKKRPQTGMEMTLCRREKIQESRDVTGLGFNYYNSVIKICSDNPFLQ